MGDVSSEGEISGYAGMAGKVKYAGQKFSEVIGDISVGTFFPAEYQREYAKERYGNEGKAVAIVNRASGLQAIAGAALLVLAPPVSVAVYALELYTMIDGAVRKTLAEETNRAYGTLAMEVPWRLAKAGGKAVRRLKESYLGEK